MWENRRATLETRRGRTRAREGEGAATVPGPCRADVRGTDELRAYRPDGPWASVLPGCAIVDEPGDACPLDVLPFVRQVAGAPGVDDVLERTLVTHDWMGARFEALLRAAPEDLVRLFGATTSISIGRPARPPRSTRVGDEPTASEAVIGPVLAGAGMDADGATIFYGYATIHEDFATPFETAMMKARHDVDVHVAFTDVVPDPDAVRCADLVVGCGVRNRLGDAAVNVRAGLAVASVYPDDAPLLEAVAAALGTQEPMAPGTSWCGNVGGAGAAPGDGSGSSVAPRAQGGGARPPAEPVSHATRHAIVDARRRVTVR